MNSKLRVCVAGATGWAASELCKGIWATDDLELVSAVSRTHAGKQLHEVIQPEGNKPVPVFASMSEALKIPCDVMVEYTSPQTAKQNILHALAAGVNVVVGTSGLSDADYQEIALEADKRRKSVLAVGNFAISVVLLNRFASMAAKYMPYWEIIDYAKQTKVDAPSGSALELSERLSRVGRPKVDVSMADTKGVKETRGANIHGMHVHSVRLPGFVISLEAIFGLEDEKLTIRHDAGATAKPYVAGALLAIRNVGSFTGLKRGLDSVMEF